MMVEIATAGMTIRTELRKKPPMPVHSMPMQAEDQALAQAARLGSCGRASRLPWRISSTLFKEVASIT